MIIQKEVRGSGLIKFFVKLLGKKTTYNGSIAILFIFSGALFLSCSISVSAFLISSSICFSKLSFLILIFLSVFSLSACMQNFNTSSLMKNNQINVDKNTNGVVALKEVFDSSVEKIPTLTAVGYAVVSSQPGRTQAQKRLMAIRSARMAAMRDLAEQIHGLKVEGNTTVIDLMVQNDTFRGIVSGVIRGARTVRINPTGSDTYETVLEIDQDMVAYLFRSAQTL